MTNIQPTNQYGFDALMDRFYSFVNNLSAGQRKGYLIGWSLVSLVLIVGASLPLGADLRWISAVVGSPAGVIVFLILAGVVETTNLKNSALFQFKENNPPRRRVSVVLFGLALVAVALIASSPILPLGVGGTIVIVVALTSYNIIRRTPDEILLAQQGLPDPREIEE